MIPTRKWTKVNKDNEITVMSFNMLADGLAQHGRFDKVGDKKFLSWEYRKELLLEIVMNSGADIVCLQEVTHFEELATIMMPSYSKAFFTPKMNSSCRMFGQRPDGCAIFIHNDFKHTEWCFEERKFCSGDQVFQVFSFSWNDEDFYVINTHLKAKHGEKLEKIRHHQATEILSAIEDVYSHARIIVTGDMNMEHNESGYKVFNDRFKDCYGGVPNHYTTWKFRDRDEKRISDYIFVKGFDVMSVLESFSDDIVPDSRFPCEWWPSDHIPVMAKLRMVKID